MIFEKTILLYFINLCPNHLLSISTRELKTKTKAKQKAIHLDIVSSQHRRE